MVFIVITWLRRCLPGFSIVKWVILRQEVNAASPPHTAPQAHPRVKWLEIHSLWTKIPRENSRTIKRAGGTLPRPQISPSHSEKTSLTTVAQKDSLEVQRGVTFCLQSFPALSTGPVLFFLPDKYFTCFPTFCLCGYSLLQSWRATGLVTVHWSSGEDLVLSPPKPQNPTSVSGGGTEALLPAAAGWGHLRAILSFQLIFYGERLWHVDILYLITISSTSFIILWLLDD